MQYKELVRESINLLDMYDPDKQYVDNFIEDCKTKTLVNHSPAEQIFITNTVYGCIVHQKLLDMVINVFYNQKGKHILKGHRNQFVVVMYLAMFHLDDLGLEQFSTIIKSFDSSKMYKFLSFFFNVTNLTTWIHGEWSQLYDVTYVKQKWIAPLLRWQPEFEGLLKYLEQKTIKGSQPKKLLKKSTEPQVFKLTKPKPRSVPAPELIPLQMKSKPVPASTHRAPKELQIIDDIKQKNQLKAQKVLCNANTQQFRCANPQKSEKTQNIISQIQQNQEAQLKFDSVYSSGTPATHKKNTLPIRMNTAAILREGALFNRQTEESLNMLDQLTQGASDLSVFLQWQKEMKMKDLKEELSQLESKLLEGKISHQEALLARQRVIKLNQKKAMLKKEETAELMRKYAEERLQEEKEMKELVQIVADGQKNPKIAKEKLHEIKKRIVKEVSEQSQELLRQALEEAQAELIRKFEIIRQIRSIESVPRLSYTFIDHTETGGHDLLCEMSLSQLRVCLARMKEEEQQVQDKRRQKIIEEKQSKGQLLLDKLNTISACRTASELATAQKKEENKKMKVRLLEAVSMDERLLALQKTLKLKQHERQRNKFEKAAYNLNEKKDSKNVNGYRHKKSSV